MIRDRRVDLERRLRDYSAPVEDDVAERSRAVVVTAYAQRRPEPPARSRRRAAIGAVAAMATALAVLTPAGAAVRELLDSAFEANTKVERPALRGLPTPGSLLVRSPGGLWVVKESGDRRRLGPYSEATWSPQGLFVGASRGSQLLALEPDGSVRWSISAPAAVRDPRWAPSGFRIAYRSGRSLRIVAGDGSGDRRFDTSVRAVAPSWRPPGASGPGENVIAYVNGDGELIAADVDRGRVLWKAVSGIERPTRIDWLADGRILVADDRRFVVVDRTGTIRISVGPEPGTRIAGLAASPRGDRVAAIRSSIRDGAPASDLVLYRLSADSVIRRSIFSGPGAITGVDFSPDGGWLLLSWDEADQWVFINPAPRQKLIRRVEAIGGISTVFDPSRPLPRGLPRIEGWCCPG